MEQWGRGSSRLTTRSAPLPVGAHSFVVNLEFQENLEIWGGKSRALVSPWELVFINCSGASGNEATQLGE